MESNGFTREHMGFFDKLGEVIGSGIKKGNDDFKNAAERAKDMSDERLIREFKDSSNSMAKRMAYGQELKRRGYGTDN